MATVVVIDDETMSADALAFLLATEGYEVFTAADGKAGLEVIDRVDPALVITDFMMPVMSGLDIARMLKADPTRTRIPLILLTAAQGEVGRRHPDLFEAVFEKPCPLRAVLDKVRELIADAEPAGGQSGSRG